LSPAIPPEASEDEVVEEISGMLALYPDEEVERASRCHGHQQKVIASRHEFDTCPVNSTTTRPNRPGFLMPEVVRTVV